MSSIDKMFRDMVTEEVARHLGPMANQMREQSAVIQRLASAFGSPIKRGPGRPPKLFSVAAAPTKAGRKGRRASAASGARDCAIIGCGRTARSKGYCSAHYQKFRNLAKTGRLPSGWVADASPNSVDNVALPRGRAGAKALAESRKKKG